MVLVATVTDAEAFRNGLAISQVCNGLLILPLKTKDGGN